MNRFHQHAWSLVNLGVQYTGLFLQPHLVCEHYSDRGGAHENHRNRACDYETRTALFFFVRYLGILCFHWIPSATRQAP